MVCATMALNLRILPLIPLMLASVLGQSLPGVTLSALGDVGLRAILGGSAPLVSFRSWSAQRSYSDDVSRYFA